MLVPSRVAAAMVEVEVVAEVVVVGPAEGAAALAQSVVVAELSLVVAEVDAMTTITVIAMSWWVGVEVRVIVVGS